MRMELKPHLNGIIRLPEKRGSLTDLASSSKGDGVVKLLSQQGEGLLPGLDVIVSFSEVISVGGGQVSRCLSIGSDSSEL